MSDIKTFQSAKAKGNLTFKIDDEEFRRGIVSMAAADDLAAIKQTLASGEDPEKMGTERLMRNIQPFIHHDDWERFKKYVLEWVEVDTFVELVNWLVEVSTGTRPTQLASSPPVSASTGGGSPDGAPPEASGTPSTST
jgi:hypothetical protein